MCTLWVIVGGANNLYKNGRPKKIVDPEMAMMGRETPNKEVTPPPPNSLFISFFEPLLPSALTEGFLERGQQRQKNASDC